ncbi:MAG: NAD(P)-dependent alcohol dehydrogenase [Flavobacterium sp.]|nr:MAG: NAD(P)-dependent alcohol dehydrogenase [Flavobacterium sp.]
MKVAQITEFSIDGITINEIEKPKIKDNQVLIRVKSASLNYLDLLVVKGIFNDQLRLPHIPVTDVSGIITEVGKDVKHFKIDDHVIPTFIPLWKKGIPTLQQLSWELRPSLGPQGFLAEYIAVDETDLVLKPEKLSFAEASTLPIAALSAWNGIKFLNLFAGNTVLIYGSGGVATFATLFAKANGYKVYVAGKNDTTLEKMLTIGADQVFNISNTNWKKDILDATQGKGVDGIYDSIGGENLNNSLDLIAVRGKITTVGLINGFSIPLNTGTFLLKQAHLIGVECGSEEDMKEMIQAITINAIQPVISAVFPFSETKRAFEHLDNGGHFGKVVIEF